MYRKGNPHRSTVVVLVLLSALTIGALGPLTKVVKAQSQSDLQSNVVWTVEDPSPVKTGRGTLREAISPNVPSAPIDGAWTTVGSTGAIDEDSVALAQVQNFTVNFLPTATGTITVRYNITATTGTSAFCPATFSMVRMRYRNSDPTGMTSKYSWELHSSNISTGGNVTMLTFASSLSLGFNKGAAFLTVTGTLGSLDFDFANNIYWLEVKIFRSDPAQFTDIGSFQFWESVGTPCP